MPAIDPGSLVANPSTRPCADGNPSVRQLDPDPGAESPLLIRCAMFRRVFVALLVLLSTAAGAESLEGTWSAPSLSRPDTPILIGLLPEGKATEQIGDYRSVGRWTSEGSSARIDWGKGWIGILRRTSDGEYRLLTWKGGSPLDGPPDDDKPAVRIVSPLD